MKTISSMLWAIVVMAFVPPALAHHSYAMFDASKTVKLEGTVKKFQWTNPHSWIYVSVPDGSGQLVEWPIEAGSPSSLSRQGWTLKTLVVGMQVKAEVHPLKDGAPGGQFLSLTLPDGKQLVAGNEGPAK